MMVKGKPGIRCLFLDSTLVRLRQEDLSLQSVWVILQNPMKERKEEGRHRRALRHAGYEGEGRVTGKIQ